MPTKHTSPLELLDDGFESRLMCSFYLKTCHQDEAMNELEKEIVQNSIESGSILNETYSLPNLTNTRVVAKLNNCLDLIETPMELEDEQAFLHTVLGHKMDDVVETKRQDMPSPVSVLDKTNDMCYESDESSSCVDSDIDETIASFWRKHREEKKVIENENEMEVDIAERSSPVLPQKNMTLEDDEEQHNCSVFPWNIEHDLIPTGRVKRAKQIKKESFVTNFKDCPSKNREAIEEPTVVKKKSLIGSKLLDLHHMDIKRHCVDLHQYTNKKRRKMNQTDEEKHKFSREKAEHHKPTGTAKQVKQIKVETTVSNFNDGLSRKSEPTVVEKNSMEDTILLSALGDEASFEKREQGNEQIEKGCIVKDGSDEQMKVDEPPQIPVKHNIGHTEDEENLELNFKANTQSRTPTCEKESVEAKKPIIVENEARDKNVLWWFGSRPKHASVLVNARLKKSCCCFYPGASHAICLVVWVIGRDLALRYGYFTYTQLQLAVDAVIGPKISSGTISQKEVRRCIQIIKNSCFQKVDASKRDNIQNETKAFREAFEKNVIDDTHLLKTLSSPWDDLDITKADDFINHNKYNGDLRFLKDGVRSFEDVLRCHIDFIREVAISANLRLTSHEWRYFFLRKDEDSTDIDITIESSPQGPSNGEDMNAGSNKPLTKYQRENEHMQVQEDDMNVEIQFECNNLKSDNISKEHLFPVITFRSDIIIR